MEDLESRKVLEHRPNNFNETISEEVQEIITAVPSWIVRWGITLVFTILGAIVLLSSLINYPDVVSTPLKVNSLNSPKTVLAYQSGKLTTLLVSDGDSVKQHQILAYMESTALPADVFLLAKVLRRLQESLNQKSLEIVDLPSNLQLGELQSAYQTFHNEFQLYQATRQNGYYIAKQAYLRKELTTIKVLKSKILNQRALQEQEFVNQQTSYEAYKSLYSKNVISKGEFLEQENKYLAAKHPLQQTETSVISNGTEYLAKEKELLDLEHIIVEQQTKFVQVLNQCVNEIDKWTLQFVLKAPLAGKVTFAGIIQQNQNVGINQEIFIVNPGNTNFYGEVQIPQYNMGKIREGQKTLIKLRSFPYEQYGLVRGTLTHVSDVAFRDSIFIAKVRFDSFENKDPLKKIQLKTGMLADADIITEESSLLQRFFRNFTKILNR
ncbi:putative HlyD family type I secretion protein [Pedobacter duraquae]|uniref:HlyD family secretion protein n=1 Tax=Pedobacter duraquae TaxID=425511 RepID=A0A4R6IK79_9SPHI|nr:biotin/lipoyl-binding protein [Pedobacter duraquae]TDO22355.1 HlyD family secretion protein [Pedobacter duraquae]